jgi:hypothetical protein
MSDRPLSSTDGDRSDDAALSRRQFVRLSAATAGAVSLSGVGSADASAPELTDLYAFVVDRVPDDRGVPTLVHLSANAFDAVEPYAVDRFRTTTDPTTAAWLRLRPADVASVAGIDAVSRLSYAPGSNPFWRLGHFPDGVFPPVADSVDYVDYEQAVDGVHRLAERHDDRVRVRSWGESPGHENLFADLETDPKELWVVEVTNDVDDEPTFREKEKVFYSLSIHGDERSGAEAGTRFLQRLLDGDEPAVESLLDDVVLLFGLTNPDGWVARRLEYRVNDDPVGDDAPENNSFKRVTATGVDPNRGYPTVGWINPAYYPAEPDGADLTDDEPGVDDDVPTEPKDYEAIVPDSLDIVEGLRGYENLTYGSDLHGMFFSENFIEGLVVNDRYDHEELNDIYELNRLTNARVTEAIGEDLAARQSRFEALNDEYLWAFGVPNPDAPAYADLFPEPTAAYEYGTIYDTIQYTTSGTLISWMSQPEEKGGLGVRMMSHEMGWDNRVLDRMVFRPWLVDLQVRGYLAAIRSVAEHAGRDVTADVVTDGETTAFVDSDTVRRRSDDLAVGGGDAVTERETVEVGSSWSATTADVGGAVTELAVTVDGRAPVLVKLRDPDGRVVRTHNGAGARSRRTVEWTVRDPAAGEWTAELKAVGGPDAGRATVAWTSVTAGDGSADAPDPGSVFGYEQRDYDVTPLDYFDDYAAFVADADEGGSPQGGTGNGGGNGNLTDAVTGLGVDAVADDGLFRGRSDRLAVENLVVSHADGAEDPDYVAALDRFLAAGGTLVCTDAGVAHLGALDTGVPADAVTRFETQIPSLEERTEDHPLLAGTRPVQRELYKVTPLGYPIDGAPVTGVDPDAFAAAGGSVAGLTAPDGGDPLVVAGSLPVGDGEVHVLGGMLPPASQETAHPFGLLSYTATFLSHTMLTNALGFTQRRYVDGDLVATLGDGD